MLGLREGPSENATVTTGLLEELVERGLQADRRRLFVIDGAKALRSAIGHVFGKRNLVQRCRNHKVRNVLGHLPKDAARTGAVDAARGVEAGGRRRVSAGWSSTRGVAGAGMAVGGGQPAEGLAELFTVNRLGLRRTAPVPDDDEHHRLVPTRAFASTRGVSRWRNGEMQCGGRRRRSVRRRRTSGGHRLPAISGC